MRRNRQPVLNQWLRSIENHYTLEQGNHSNIVQPKATKQTKQEALPWKI